ncbi:MAG: hypothetical protein KME26_31395 [Oscillatoria princeps RMCB-10]|jgi:hypothetical protein|nr:hypothetical protein [Oscillatoria princeps RMCB-10]
METFEPGIKSAYSLHQFREGEQGMKCLRPGCTRVMTIAEWEEKRRCFCQYTNAVLATARSAPPTRLETFQAGVACCWTAHKFVANERGMKCLTCEKVMTNQAWEVKGKCILGHTNAAPAIAIYPGEQYPPLPVWRPRAPFPQKWQIIVISALSGFLVFVIVALLTK